MWPFKKNSPAPAPAAPAQTSKPQGRKGDGTILGDLIKQGVYAQNAGMEKLGHFDPACAPFRTFPNGKTGLMAGQLADQLLQMLREPGVDTMMMAMAGGSGDLAVELGRRLRLGSCQGVLNAFQELAKDEAIGNYLIVTTTMPFFLTYSTGKKAVVAEVEYELRLNALANLLLHDREFEGVITPQMFRQKAAGLFDGRKEEVERMKAWAVERM